MTIFERVREHYDEALTISQKTKLWESFFKVLKTMDSILRNRM